MPTCENTVSSTQLEVQQTPTTGHLLIVVNDIVKKLGEVDLSAISNLSASLNSINAALTTLSQQLSGLGNTQNTQEADITALENAMTSLSPLPTAVNDLSAASAALSTQVDAVEQSVADMDLTNVVRVVGTVEW